jgi:peptidoglycan L-alanyl-D-glutamate endopeptidase CwlK
MPKFGKRSRANLKSCSPELVALFEEVVEYFDCTVICGHRAQEEQDKAFHDGFSKVKYPDGRHNANPSTAVDVCPYPVDWQDLDRFRYFAGFVLGIASQMNISVRWGGDWDRDTQVKDNKFNDLPHFEIYEKK